MTHQPSARVRSILLAAPVILFSSTYAAFSLLTSALGTKAGYFAGFLFYWVGWCFLFSLWLVGKEGLVDMFRDVRPRLGRPAWVGAVCLLLPPLFTLTYAFPKLLPRANLLIAVASLVIAIVNATAEEVLWRGVFARVFPGSVWAGYLYPAVGFALWHYSPQLVLPSGYPGGSTGLVLFSLILGLMWGFVSWRTKSIRWTLVSHILLDFSGLGALFYFS